MIELISAATLMLILFGVSYCQNETEENFRQKVIKEKGFCIEKEDSGISLKKCWDVEERK